MKIEKIALGTIVAIVGIVWLLANLGLVSNEVVRELWLYWPILLVIWGILLFFGKGGDSAGYLLVVLVIIFIVFGLFAFTGPYHRNQPVRRHRIGTAIEEKNSAVPLSVPWHSSRG